jgi:sugar phosphate isomerase/epimerase
MRVLRGDLRCTRRRVTIHTGNMTRFSRWVCLVPLLLAACGDDGSPVDADDALREDIANYPPSDTAGDEPVGQRHLPSIGVQLYTVRAAMQADFEGTLRSLADMGYTEVEFAGLFGRDPAQVAVLLAELGLTAIGSHVTYDRFLANPDAAIEETLALGARFLVFPWLPDTERRTIADWQEWVALLNRVGQASQARGLELAYHNHDFEFTPIDGVRPIDVLLDGIDREVVKWELDLYWLAKAGGSPSEMFARYPGGFPLGHVKDMRLSDQAMMDVGQGDLDFAAVFAQGAASGMEHFIVEHDEPADPLQSVRNSVTYLKALTF